MVTLLLVISVLALVLVAYTGLNLLVLTLLYVGVIGLYLIISRIRGDL